jgi:molecular chaperone DnaJ
VEVKDHYSILGLTPSASQADIKRAYRTKAHELHPDKNPDDPYASIQFNAIKEAYETLSNPTLKEQYLQQRWYAQSLGKKKFGEVVTPLTILKKLLLLDQYVSALDPHRLDQYSLFKQVDDLLAEDVLLIKRDADLHDEIARTSMSVVRDIQYTYQAAIAERIKKITDTPAIHQQFYQKLKKTAALERWEKWRPLLLLLAVILLCLIIVFINPN